MGGFGRWANGQHDTSVRGAQALVGFSIAERSGLNWRQGVGYTEGWHERQAAREAALSEHGVNEHGGAAHVSIAGEAVGRQESSQYNIFGSPKMLEREYAMTGVRTPLLPPLVTALVCIYI